MPTTCQFKFSRTTPIYYSGEQITGSITLSTTKQLPVEAIQLALIGIEHVKWWEKSSGALILHNDSIEKDNKEIYNGKQEHLHESYMLAKGVRLQPGEVRVEEFCFTLPHDIPASCQMIYGEVVYYVQLLLQRKSVFNKIFKARITVKNRLDLSDATELVEPHSQTITSAPLNVLVTESPLNFTLSTGTGYVPGQTITYTLRGRNTFASCNKIRVNLCQWSSFRAISPQTKIKKLVKVLQTDGQKIGSSYVTVCGQLGIPLVAHISLQSNENHLIQISHHIEVMLFNKKRILQKLIIPIVIGTVPPKRNELTPEEKCMEKLEYFYCYDNLATDEICDSSTDSHYLAKVYVPNLTNTLHMSSWEKSKEMLQQHVATSTSQLTVCKADIFDRLQSLAIQHECPT